MKLMNLGIPMMGAMSIVLAAQAQAEAHSKEESKPRQKYEIYNSSYTQRLDGTSDLATAIKHFKTLKASGQCGINPFKLADNECTVGFQTSDARPHGYYVISMGGSLTQLTVATTFDEAFEALAKLQENGFCRNAQDYGTECHLHSFDSEAL
jgi:hypothetical protein